MALARRLETPARWRGTMDAPVSQYGAMAALTALLTVMVSSYLALTGRQCSIPLLVALYGVGAAEIVVLCRVAVPSWIQGALVLFIIASLTTLTARTDVFGVHGVDPVLTADPAIAPVRKPAPAAAEPARRAGSAFGGSGGAGGGGSGEAVGAKVILEPAGAGDNGWAKMLNAAYDRRLGGAQATGLMISGNVGARQVGKDVSVEVHWSISSNGVSVPCGSTSAYGSDYPALSEQFRHGFGLALSRSVETQRVSCP
jgi:hypothetical protein